MVKEIIIGTDLVDDVKKYDVILIGASIKNSKGNGFMHKICRNFPDIDKVNKETNYDDINKLGTCQVVTSYVNQGFPIFVLCYITKGRYNPTVKPDALNYEALKSCLELVNEHFKGKRVASTLIGNSNFEAGGDAKRIYEIIAETTDDIDLYIYDYEQLNYRYEDNLNYFAILNDWHDKKISKEEYYEKKSKFVWDKAFGKYLVPMPKGLNFFQIQKKIKEIKGTEK